MKHRFILSSLCVSLCVLTLKAGAANIYMDEDFEGATPFVDRNWPVFGSPDGVGAIQPAPTQQTVDVKGICLRSFDNSTTSKDPRPIILNTGTVVSTRYFLGSQCLQLATGQSVSGGKTAYVSQRSGEYKFFQFALSFPPGAAAQPLGTVIGRFKEDWSTTTYGLLQGSLVLQFRVASGNKIEIYCVNTSSVVATMDAGPGHWALISMITQIRDPGSITTSGPFTWYAFDPLTSVNKGPVPAPGTTLPSGTHIYVNSKTEAVYVLPDQIGTGWGSDNSDTPANTFNSEELGWEIVAENDTLFVDDMYWDTGYHRDGRPSDVQYYKFAEEEAARMNEFTQPTTEPGGQPPAAAAHWLMYE